MHAPSRKQFIFTLVILLMAIAPVSLVFSNPTTDGKIPPPLSVTITLEGQQTVLFNGRKTSLTDISEILEKEAAQKGGSPLIIIDGEGDIPMGLLHEDTRYGAFVQVLGYLKDAGANRIAITDVSG